MNYVDRMKRKSFQENLLRPGYGSSDDAAGLSGTVYQTCEKCDVQGSTYRPTAGFAEATAFAQK
jgi:hypothetical protein